MSMRGQVIVSGMTEQLDAKAYHISKCYAWMNLLNEGMKPVGFLQPTKKGTKINIISLESEQDYEFALMELEGFMYAVNKRFGTDLKCTQPTGKKA